MADKMLNIEDILIENIEESRDIKTHIEDIEDPVPMITAVEDVCAEPAHAPDTIVLDQPVLVYCTANTVQPLCYVTGVIGILDNMNNGFLHISAVVGGVGRIQGYIKYTI